MKYFGLYIVLLFSIRSQAQNKLMLNDNFSLSYVYTEYKESYEHMAERIQAFTHECSEQGLDSFISGSMLSIHLENETPTWRLAFPVIQNMLEVDSPLFTGKLEYENTISKKYPSRVEKYDVELLRMEIREMGFFISGPTMIRTINDPSGINTPGREVIIPIQGIYSKAYFTGKISRFLIMLSIGFYLFFAVFFLIHRNGRRVNNVFFALFLVGCAMMCYDWIIGFFRFTAFTHFPRLMYLGIPFNYLIAPSLYFYTLSSLYKNFRIRKHHLLHLVPFIAVIIILTLRLARHSESQLKRYIMDGSLFTPFEELASSLVFHAQMIGYIGAAVIIFFIYKKRLKHQASSVLPQQYTWLGIVLFGFLGMTYIMYLKHYLYHLIGSIDMLLFILRIGSYMVFALIILYYALIHPEIFSLIDISFIKQKSASLSSSVLENYKKKLTDYMRDHKPHLISDLTISKLAEFTFIPPRSLSEVINKGFDQTFFEFINTYRIQEAKQLIARSHTSNKTILEILYEVGYNNKSVFNATFKKYTGTTPTQYKIQNVN